MTRRTGSALLLLSAVAMLLWAALPGRTQEAPSDPQAERHRANLDAVLSEFTLKDATFEQALDHLRQAAGTNIIVDGVAAGRIDGARKITLSLTRLQVAEVLDGLLSVYRKGGAEPITYDVHSGVIWVGAPVAMRPGSRVTYVYDISDFTGRFFLPNVQPPEPDGPLRSSQHEWLEWLAATSTPVSDELRQSLARRGMEPSAMTSQECIETLLHLITQSIAPRSWDMEDRVSPIEERGGLLIVRTTFQNQVAVQRLLKNLRAARERLDRGAPPTTQPLDLLAP